MSIHKKAWMYFWVDGQCVQQDWEIKPILGVLCVDDYQTKPMERYGTWVYVEPDAEHEYDYRWESVSLNQFPPEFKMQCLLLGVS